MSLSRSIGRRALLQAAGAGLIAGPAFAAAEGQDTDWKALAEDVKAQMAWAWSQYVEHAWGRDQIKPVSGGAESFFFKDRDLGLSIVEALDTLWVMGLDAQFEQGVDWTVKNLRFDIDADIQLFETSIRLVGGLLSAHHAAATSGCWIWPRT